MKSQCLYVTICKAFFLPEVVKCNAEIFGVFLLIPQQQLLSWFNRSRATVENSPSILKSHQILFFIVTSTIHIPEGKKQNNRKKAYMKKNKRVIMN